jgi:hypothetical protein
MTHDPPIYDKGFTEMTAKPSFRSFQFFPDVKAEPSEMLAVMSLSLNMVYRQMWSVLGARKIDGPARLMLLTNLVAVQFHRSCFVLLTIVN